MTRPLESTRARVALALQGDQLRPRAALQGGAGRGERWPTRRRPGDVLRLIGGLVVLVTASVAVHAAHPTVVEINLFRLINELPDPAGAPLLGVMQLGALVAVPILAAGVLIMGRRRLALVVAVTGCGAWGAAKLIQYLVDEDPPQLRLSHVVLRDASHPGLAFPASHVAIVAALATVAAPYVRRSTGRLIWLVVALVAVARIYVGLHLPMDVVGGLALGWDRRRRREPRGGGARSGAEPQPALGPLGRTRVRPRPHRSPEPGGGSPLLRDRRRPGRPGQDH